MLLVSEKETTTLFPPDLTAISNGQVKAVMKIRTCTSDAGSSCGAYSTIY